MKYEKFSRIYSPAKLRKKIATCARKAGIKVINMALILYYVATDSHTSIKDKASIYGVLGYFILPLDVLPDSVPFLGFSDDLSALVWAIATITHNITPEIKQRAKEQLNRWFSHVDESDLTLTGHRDKNRHRIR